MMWSYHSSNSCVSGLLGTYQGPNKWGKGKDFILYFYDYYYDFFFKRMILMDKREAGKFRGHRGYLNKVLM